MTASPPDLLAACCLLTLLGGLASAAPQPQFQDEGKDKQQEVELKVNQSELAKETTKRSVEVERGKRLAIRLEYKATGYVWKLKSRDKKALELIGKPAIEKTANKPGAAEYKVYRFNVKDAGTATFSLARSFGKDKREKRLVVSVRPKKPSQETPPKMP